MQIAAGADAPDHALQPAVVVAVSVRHLDHSHAGLSRKSRANLFLANTLCGPGDGIAVTEGKQVRPGSFRSEALPFSQAGCTTPGEWRRAVGTPKRPHEVGRVIMADPMPDLLHSQVGLY